MALLSSLPSCAPSAGDIAASQLTLAALFPDSFSLFAEFSKFTAKTVRPPFTAKTVRIPALALAAAPPTESLYVDYHGSAAGAGVPWQQVDRAEAKGATGAEGLPGCLGEACKLGMAAMKEARVVHMESVMKVTFLLNAHGEHMERPWWCPIGLG